MQTKISNIIMNYKNICKWEKLFLVVNKLRWDGKATVGRERQKEKRKGKNLTTSELSFDQSSYSHLSWMSDKTRSLGTLGWLSQLGNQFLISAQVLISVWWIQAQHWIPCWAWSLLEGKRRRRRRRKKKEKKKKRRRGLLF